MTTRNGGVSKGAWRGASGGGMNLGAGSGDGLDAVELNRAILARHLPSEPAWLTQVHGTRVVDAAALAPGTEADASYTSAPGRVCAILVADCLPVLFTDRQGTRVAAAHAGWRGLAGGVLEATLAASGLVPADTLAWIGPAIGPSRFEVGDEVREAFIADAGPEVVACFGSHAPGKWLADLPALARLRLVAQGVASIHASDACTASDGRRFYSYRRDGVTGRMAALIWIDH
jgi:YfiH family protein